MTNDTSDDDLLASIAGAEPGLPSRLVEQTKALLSWRTIDHDIVQLLVDSVDDERAPVRSGDSSIRHVEFGSGKRRLHIDHLVDRQTVVGRLTAVDADEVTAVWVDGSTERAVIEGGRFELPVRPGPVRFVVTREGRRPLATEWMTLG